MALASEYTDFIDEEDGWSAGSLSPERLTPKQRKLELENVRARRRALEEGAWNCSPVKVTTICRVEQQG